MNRCLAHSPAPSVTLELTSITIAAWRKRVCVQVMARCHTERIISYNNVDNRQRARCNPRETDLTLALAHSEGGRRKSPTALLLGPHRDVRTLELVACAVVLRVVALIPLSRCIYLQKAPRKAKVTLTCIDMATRVHSCVQ